MIEGMKFHVKGVELQNLLSTRAEWHKERVKVNLVNLKQAREGMEVAAAAAVAAGKAAGVVRRSSLESLEIASTYSATRQRNYGGSIEDPVAAINEAIAHHTNRAASLEFYSKHVLVEETYVLTENELRSYELIPVLELTEEE